MKLNKVGGFVVLPVVTAIYATISWKCSSAFNVGGSHMVVQHLLTKSVSTSLCHHRLATGCLRMTNNNNNNNHNEDTETMTSLATKTTTTTTTNSEESDNPLGLTSELKKLTTAFQNIGDDKLRYKQLLYMANQLQPLDASVQIPENKVRGCLSTVYVDGSVLPSSNTDNSDNNNNDIKIQFIGDSDGVLTKGLVAFLIRGLSGNTASQIQQVNPQFIQQAGISTSLTPGRNNGFLNMLAAMKQKAIQLEQNEIQQRQSQNSQKQQPAVSSEQNEKSDSKSDPILSNNTNNNGPIYNKIVVALQVLQPKTLVLEDVSYQHSGHVGSKDFSNGESHFELYIVADAFDGLNLVKRHKLIYMMLGDIMPQIHALQIQAKTISESTM